MSDDFLPTLIVAGGAVLFVVGGWLHERRRSAADRRQRGRATQASIARVLRPQDAHPIVEVGRRPWKKGDAYHGKLASGREALVWRPGSIVVEIDAPHAPRVSVRRRGLLDLLGDRPQNALVVLKKLVIVSLDAQRTRKTFATHETLNDRVFAAFEDFSVQSLLLWDGKLRATVKKRIAGSRLPVLLSLLDEIVGAFEPVPVKVTVLGGERRALLGLSGNPRCSYCHADVTGEETDLVACALCRTILHDGCWREHGHCPVLGCTGQEPERPGSGPGERERVPG